MPSDAEVIRIADKIRDICKDPKHPYNDRRAPAHEEAVREMADLYGQLFPDQEGGSEL
jgi:hypothetical protein